MAGSVLDLSHKYGEAPLVENHGRHVCVWGRVRTRLQRCFWVDEKSARAYSSAVDGLSINLKTFEWSSTDTMHDEAPMFGVGFVSDIAKFPFRQAADGHLCGTVSQQRERLQRHVGHAFESYARA